MTEIRVDKNMTREVLREQLKSFGSFSTVKASVDDNNPDIIILHEVTISERLWNYCTLSKEERYEGRRKSKAALIKLAEQHPDIEKVLGGAIIFKKFLTKSEMQERLKFESNTLRKSNNSKALQIPFAGSGRGGVTDAKLSEVEADCRIVWKLSLSQVSGAFFDPVVSDQGIKEIQVLHSDAPTNADLTKIYKNSLEKVSGHILISPIADVPVESRAKTLDRVHKKNSKNTESEDDTSNSDGYRPVDVVGYRSAYSDNSIKALLIAVNEAQRNNPKLRVTICTGDLAEKNMLSRVVDQQAILEAEVRRAIPKSRDRVSMPESLEIIQRSDEDGMVVHQSGINESNLKTYATRFKNINICYAEPGKLSADTAFLNFDEIKRRAKELGSLSDARFSEIFYEVFQSSGVIRDQAIEIQNYALEKWGIKALELPPCEMPAMKLYAFNTLESNPPSKEAVKDFFKSHLRGLTGRVVIQITGNTSLDEGLAEALEELVQKPGGLACEVMLSSNNQEAIDQFLAMTILENKETLATAS